MPANNTLELTDINFDGIKANLQNFLSNQTELGDYDYESSTMQILINLLSYNTYMNSYYLNMVGNEMFLDSAQIRNNVVSRSKMLGYTPRSAHGSKAVVQVTITPDDSPAVITIPRNTQFKSTVDGKQYIFVNEESQTMNVDSSGVYSTNLEIVEGRVFDFKYIVSTDNPQRYMIPADNVDTRSIKVTVQETTANSNVTTFLSADDITDLISSSPVYYLMESDDGRYELTFGDNILSKRLDDGNILNINYRVCNGSATNGASVFNNVSSIDGYSSVSVQYNSRSAGGGEKETIQSVKLNAPKNYEAQNRAVTHKDYEHVVKKQFADVSAVSVWGGEDNTPPIYGRVYVSVKPVSSTVLAEDRKKEIKAYLSKKNVLTIEPELVDPTYLYVKPAITIKFNPDLTSLTVGELNTVAGECLINYERNTVGLFSQSFVTSQLMREFYSSNESFSSIQIELEMEKKFVPNLTQSTTYTINFNNPIINFDNTTKEINVGSSKFTYEGNPNSYFDDDGLGNLRIYVASLSGVRTYVNRTAGTVDYINGTIIINSLLITAFEGDAITISAIPDKQDIDAIRNQLILIKDASLTLFNTRTKTNVSLVSDISTQGTNARIPESGVLTTVY